MANRVLPFSDPSPVSAMGLSRAAAGLGPQRAFLSFYRRCLAFNLWLAFRPPTPGRAADVAGIRSRLSRESGRFFGNLAARDLVHCRGEGLEEAADWRGSIVAANHPSLLDALWFFWKMPGIGCVVGNKPRGNPLLSRPARLADFVPRDPALAMIKECRRRLGRGENILLFPEGTRTTQGALDPFLVGPALVAVKSGAPIRTVFIECNSLHLGKGYSVFHPLREPVVFRFSAGGVFRAAAGESARSLAQRLEDYFRGELVREGGRIFRRQRAGGG